MPFQLFGPSGVAAWLLSACMCLSALGAQAPADEAAMPYDPDTRALLLARQYLEGGPGARAALLDALQHMGWGVRDAQGNVVHAPPAGANTGLAMRDYELEELLWNPSAQPTIRLISFAQALAVPFEDTDPEELAQTLVETIRRSANSEQPQQRFWGRFIVALGRVGAANYDLSAAAPPPVMPPDERQLRNLTVESMQDPMALLQAMQPKPVWSPSDPVLAPSPRPEPADDDEPRLSTAQRDEQRMEELSDELDELTDALMSQDETRRQAAEAKMQQLNAEMAAISARIQSAAMQQMATAAQQFRQHQDSDDEEDEDDEAYEDDEYEDADDDPRFLAEWRDQPLSLLQVALITRVLAADVRKAATQGSTGVAARSWRWPRLPLATMQLAQATGGSGPSFSGQFAGAAGDIWATGWGAYTGPLLEQHLPDSKFTKGVGIANILIAWFKTIMTVARQNITITVENEPLVRTKTRAAGERRTARAKVEVDFPKHDVLKALRAAGNLSSLDLQLPDGGPIGGAKVVWRLPEGSYNGKYQTAEGGWQYRPDLAVVQFAQAGGKDAYVSTTNDAGEATITLEGVPQKKNLPPTVRPQPRRAVVAVEVTMKVGNLTQDLNDAIGTALGGPIGGGLGFVADMVLRTSFFFQAGRVFEVRDWKEPAWEGEFEVTIKGSGSKREEGEKGGPDVEYAWKMDRYIEGRFYTPEWEEASEVEKNYEADGRHRFVIDGDSRYFRINDSSSAKSRDTDNRYQATGPLQIQPPGHNQLARYSRAEPSGTAELLFVTPKMQLTLEPFFGAECLVSRSESSGGRSANRSGAEYLSLLDALSPESFTIIEDNDGSGEVIEGEKTFDYYKGNLPYVPSFDVVVTVKYRLWRNNPPPTNK